ncbi:hypothetical protein HAX54_001552, partial [Datura stramonium]|nr:hypothetical protein [Datura stramonium]
MLNCVSPASHRSTPAKHRLRRKSRFKDLGHYPTLEFHLRVKGWGQQNAGVAQVERHSAQLFAQ